MKFKNHYLIDVEITRIPFLVAFVIIFVSLEGGITFLRDLSHSCHFFQFQLSLNIFSASATTFRWSQIWTGNNTAHTFICHRNLFRTFWLISGPVANALLKFLVKLDNRVIMLRLHLFYRVFKFFFKSNKILNSKTNTYWIVSASLMRRCSSTW